MVSLLRKNGRNRARKPRQNSNSLRRKFRRLFTVLLLLPLAIFFYRIGIIVTKLPNADVAPNHPCLDCGTGTCLVNRCICVDPAHSGLHCDKPNPNYNAHSIACIKGNDDRCMNIVGYGRLKTLSQQRIQKSRKCEVLWWETSKGIPIRNQQQLVAFDYFHALPRNLGHVLELGSGPYTKSRLIMEQQPSRNIDSVTLVDPLLDEYLSNPNITTSFDQNQLCVDSSNCIPAKLLSVTAESLSSLDNNRQYDTILLVNTLEHTENAVMILHNIYQKLKPRGILVFGEEYATSFQLQTADPCHPIRIQRRLFDEYLDLFGEHLLSPRTGLDIPEITHQGVKQSVYAIVRK